MTLILFDIDGTLVNTGGAGMRAMNRTFAELVGVGNALDGIQLAGRTDRVIVGDAAERLTPRVHVDDGWLSHFRDAYCAKLEQELADGRGTSKRVLPGVEALLDTLRPRPDVQLALLTGNFARAARIKLAHFDLWDYFACGAFGDHHVDRNPLLAVAVEAAAACRDADVSHDEVVVIGDTPHDVACARAGGARAVAVATGLHSADDLHEAGADIVFDDLRDTRAVIEAGFRLVAHS